MSSGWRVSDLGSLVRSTPILVAVVLALLGAPILLPSLVGAYEMSILIRILILALFAISFNLLFGYTGLLSFGHAAYYGVGAYMVAIIVTGALSFMPATVETFAAAAVISVLVVTAFAVVFGRLCVMRGGLYFAMLTFAFSMMVFHLARDVLTDVTGGDDGIILPASTAVDLGVVSFLTVDTQYYYYFTLVTVLVTLFAIYRIVNSPYGELLVSIRENEQRARFVGVNVTRYQWSAFVISGLFSGVAGVLVAARNFVITPDLLHWTVGVEPILATLIGGPSTFLGPAIGAGIYILLEEVISSVTPNWHLAVGIILVPIVLYFPGGVYGTLMDGDWRSWGEEARATLSRSDDLPREGDDR